MIRGNPAGRHRSIADALADRRPDIARLLDQTALNALAHTRTWGSLHRAMEAHGMTYAVARGGEDGRPERLGGFYLTDTDGIPVACVALARDVHPDLEIGALEAELGGYVEPGYAEADRPFAGGRVVPGPESADRHLRTRVQMAYDARGSVPEMTRWGIEQYGKREGWERFQAYFEGLDRARPQERAREPDRDL